MKNRFLFLCFFYLVLLLFFSILLLFSFPLTIILLCSILLFFSFSFYHSYSLFLFFSFPCFFSLPFFFVHFFFSFTLFSLSIFFFLLSASIFFSLLLSLLLLFLRLEFFTLRDYPKTEVSTQLPNSFRSYFSSFFGQFGLVRFGSVWSQTIVAALVSISISVIASSCDTVAPFGQKTNKNNNSIRGTLKAARK